MASLTLSRKYFEKAKFILKENQKFHDKDPIKRIQAYLQGPIGLSME